MKKGWSVKAATVNERLPSEMRPYSPALVWGKGDGRGASKPENARILTETPHMDGACFLPGTDGYVAYQVARPLCYVRSTQVTIRHVW